MNKAANIFKIFSRIAVWIGFTSRSGVIALLLVSIYGYEASAAEKADCGYFSRPPLQRIEVRDQSAKSTSAADFNKTLKVSGCSGLVAVAPKDCYAREIARIAPNQVRCYQGVFIQESSCHFDCTQRRGQAGNAQIGYGLCTIEKDPVIRRMHGRGPACTDISSPSGQVACCISIMRHSPSYFGSATPKC